MVRRLLMLLLLLAATGLARATDLPGPPDLPAPAPGAHAAEPPSLHAFGDRDPGCAEWTDACRTCTRAADGAHSCSNIGPACQPKEVQCARRNVAPKTDDAPAKGAK